MADFTLFLNSFLSYLLLFVLIAVLAVIAVAIGITMRKKKNAQGGCGSPDPGDRRSTGAGNAVLTENQEKCLRLTKRVGMSRSFL